MVTQLHLPNWIYIETIYIEKKKGIFLGYAHI